MSKVLSKKGISLVALVITIIVLIILTAAVVVTGINTPRNTEYAIKMHNQSAVQDAVTLYIMTSMLDGMDNYDPSTAGSYTVKDVDDIVPELYNISTKQWTTNAATKLGINLTQEELQAVFTLDSKGVVGWVAGQEPTLETDENNQQQPTTATTLGSLISGPSMYGITVTGYNGNGIESWQVLYKQKVGTEDYVYIIPEGQTAYTALTLYSGNNASSIISNAKTYFGLSDSFDTVGTGNDNYKATLWLLDTSVWATYKDSNFGDNVVGVIGSPTMEMMVASYNTKNAGVSGFTNLSYTVNSTGYSAPRSFSGAPYVNGNYYWLACPSSNNTIYVRSVDSDGPVSNTTITVRLASCVL